MTLRKAHAALSRLLETGSVVVQVPTVESVARLTEELSQAGIAAVRHEPPPEINVGAIRRLTGMSQEEFALNYGFDVDTVQNWEQGRSRPDKASRAYLFVIQKCPELVGEMLDAEVAGV